jgi:hypothetical protein
MAIIANAHHKTSRRISSNFLHKPQSFNSSSVSGA